MVPATVLDLEELNPDECPPFKFDWSEAGERPQREKNLFIIMEIGVKKPGMDLDIALTTPGRIVWAVNGFSGNSIVFSSRRDVLVPFKKRPEELYLVLFVFGGGEKIKKIRKVNDFVVREFAKRNKLIELIGFTWFSTVNTNL